MKKLTALVLIVLCTVLATCALADRMYVLPDSSIRKLSRAEVEEWDYESLGYAFNEIMARHGYNFNPGQHYDYYFKTMPWYEPNANPDKQIVYDALSDVEWYNYNLIKDVRSYKKYADWGLSIWDNFSTGIQKLAPQGFDYVELKSNQVLYVYSAPDKSSWRGANGKAEVSTNGAIYAAGWESGWLLLMYETNNGSVRVGYVDSNQIKGNVPVNKYLDYAYEPAVVTDRCVLTDDPARTNTSITTLKAGTEVTYLTCYFNNQAWDYIEVEVNGQIARGFVKAGSIAVMTDDPLDSLDSGLWLD